MWVIRTHTIGLPYSESFRRVRNKYLSEVERGVLPTQAFMDEWISKKMSNCTEDATFSIMVPEELAEACQIESSMETYYNELARGDAVNVVGVRTRKRIRCTICMSPKFTKIKLPCGHIYHRKCIDEWARWKPSCPICMEPVTIVKDRCTQSK